MSEDVGNILGGEASPEANAVCGEHSVVVREVVSSIDNYVKHHLWVDSRTVVSERKCYQSHCIYWVDPNIPHGKIRYAIIEDIDKYAIAYVDCIVGDMDGTLVPKFCRYRASVEEYSTASGRILYGPDELLTNTIECIIEHARENIDASYSK